MRGGSSVRTCMRDKTEFDHADSAVTLVLTFSV